MFVFVFVFVSVFVSVFGSLFNIYHKFLPQHTSSGPWGRTSTGYRHRGLFGAKWESNFKEQAIRLMIELTLYSSGEDDEKYDCPAHRGGSS